MTTQQTKVDYWGPEIEVGSKRPDWLGDGTRVWVHWEREGWSSLIDPEWTAEKFDRGDWSRIIAMRLPADHPHYAQPKAPTPSPELTARMVAFVRVVANCTPTEGSEVDRLIVGNARAFMAELEPVDPDVTFAREMFDVAFPDGSYAWDTPAVRDGWIRAAKHVRALAEAGK